MDRRVKYGFNVEHTGENYRGTEVSLTISADQQMIAKALKETTLPVLDQTSLLSSGIIGVKKYENYDPKLNINIYEIGRLESRTDKERALNYAARLLCSFKDMDTINNNDVRPFRILDYEIKKGASKYIYQIQNFKKTGTEQVTEAALSGMLDMSFSIDPRSTSLIRNNQRNKQLELENIDFTDKELAYERGLHCFADSETNTLHLRTSAIMNHQTAAELRCSAESNGRDGYVWLSGESGPGQTGSLILLAGALAVAQANTNIKKK
ncbi:MAG: hypothetical protein WCK80_00865 [bacterium]